MKAKEYKALSFIEKVKKLVEVSGVNVEVESMDPGILSDIGEEGVVFDKYVIYLAKGEYEFVDLNLENNWGEAQLHLSLCPAPIIPLPSACGRILPGPRPLHPRPGLPRKPRLDR